MTTDADDALIAKLLAEDNAYGDPYYRDFDEYHSDDSEHGRSKRRKKTIKRGDLLSHTRSMVFQHFKEKRGSQLTFSYRHRHPEGRCQGRQMHRTSTTTGNACACKQEWRGTRG